MGDLAMTACEQQTCLVTRCGSPCSYAETWPESRVRCSTLRTRWWRGYPRREGDSRASEVAQLTPSKHRLSAGASDDWSACGVLDCSCLDSSGGAARGPMASVRGRFDSSEPTRRTKPIRVPGHVAFSYRI